MDRNCVKIYVEKLINYQDLEIEIQNFWNTQKVKTIPIIVAALRTICEVLKENLYNKCFLLGFLHILFINFILSF